MKTLLRLFCLIFASCLLLAGSSAAAPAKKAAPKAGARLDRSKDYINALLKQRLSPEPLPDVLPNPFELTGAPPPVLAASGPVAPAAVLITPASDDERLMQHASALKISGIVRLNGVTHLIINQSPYKEGDTISVGTKEEGPFLQIVRIAPGALTLRFNEAVRTLKFTM